MKNLSLLALCLCCFFVLPCNAQEAKNSKPNTFGFEVGGAGIYGSAYYERSIWQPLVFQGIRTGDHLFKKLGQQRTH